jgi:hypothetical protein
MQNKQDIAVSQANSAGDLTASLTCQCRFAKKIFGIFLHRYSGMKNSMEFSSTDTPARKILRNFLPRKLRHEKFIGIFFHGHSGTKNSMEFSFMDTPARKIPWNFLSQILRHEKFRGISHHRFRLPLHSTAFFIIIPKPKN